MPEHWTPPPWPRFGVVKIDHEAGHLATSRWFVPSETTAPGAYWPVVLSGHRLTCACPAGVRLAAMEDAGYASNGCRHMRLVVKAEEAGSRPLPVGKPNVSALIS